MFTNNPDERNKAINLLSSEQGERFILLLSDGVPKISGEDEEITKQDTLGAANTAASRDITIYTVAMEGAGDYSFIEEVALTTGGRAFDVRSEQDIREVMDEIERDVFFPGMVSLPNNEPCVRVEMK